MNAQEWQSFGGLPLLQQEINQWQRCVCHLPLARTYPHIQETRDMTKLSSWQAAFVTRL
jgi:hypothetical protein